MAYTRQRAILAKIEVTEGTDPTPTGAANAILCSNITVKPVAGSTVDRPLAFPSFGATPKVHINKNVTVQLDVEFSGAGAAGTAPAYGPLLRACGLSETLTALTSAVYAPISTGQESCTIYANESGTLHKLTGARGTVSLIFAKNDVPHLRFSMTGRWNVPTAVALPSLTTTAWIDPLEVGKVNTPTFTLDGYSGVLENLQIDLGNNVVYRNRPGSESVRITGRTGAGQISVEAPALGTKDFFAIAIANTQIALSLMHGTVAGNIVQIDAPKLQLLQPDYQDVDGIRILQANFQLNRNSGDDELVITVK